MKLRLDRQQELSFLEFNYMILQAYDFVELNKRTGCVLQMGGSDQWGNIVNGIDLGRRMSNAQLFALTSPLITTASGAKMGKTAAGAVWLNADMVSPYDYWQYWRNTEDGDVARFLKLFTVLPLDEIAPARRAARARRSTRRRRCSPPKRPRWCTAAPPPTRPPRPRARTFEEGALAENLPTVEIAARRARRGSACSPPSCSAGLVSSNGEARRQIKGGGLRVNDATVTDEKMMLTPRTAHAGRRDQAFARQEAARAAEAGLISRRWLSAGSAACIRIPKPASAQRHPPRRAPAGLQRCQTALRG